VQTAPNINTKLEEAGLLSTQTAIKLLDLVEKPADELALIDEEAAKEKPTNKQV